jgi:hypothetical protein
VSLLPFRSQALRQRLAHRTAALTITIAVVPQTQQSTTTETTRAWRCVMSNDAYTHYVVLNETILGEARIIEKCNEWISLAFVKLGTGSPKPFNDYAFVENRTLVPKTVN